MHKSGNQQTLLTLCKHLMQARWHAQRGFMRTSNMQEHVREETFDEAAKQEADFFSYIATSYKHYLNGDDEECARVDSEQRQAFEEKAQAAENQVSELQQVGPSSCGFVLPESTVSHIAACQHCLKSYEEEHVCLDSKHRQALWTRGRPLISRYSDMRKVQINITKLSDIPSIRR